MNKYFTNLVIENNQFVAVVYDSASNQELYRSKPYTTQTKAMQDVNDFLVGRKTIVATTPKSTQEPLSQTIINTATMIPVPTASPRRCCGR